MTVLCNIFIANTLGTLCEIKQMSPGYLVYTTTWLRAGPITNVYQQQSSCQLLITKAHPTKAFPYNTVAIGNVLGKYVIILTKYLQKHDRNIMK